MTEIMKLTLSIRLLFIYVFYLGYFCFLVQIFFSSSSFRFISLFLPLFHSLPLSSALYFFPCCSPALSLCSSPSLAICFLILSLAHTHARPSTSTSTINWQTLRHAERIINAREMNVGNIFFIFTISDLFARILCIHETHSFDFGLFIPFFRNQCIHLMPRCAQKRKAQTDTSNRYSSKAALPLYPSVLEENQSMDVAGADDLVCYYRPQ